MVPESAFTEEVKKGLPELNLTLEMAVAAEWVVRDNDLPDHLDLVFVSAHDIDDELQGACSCIDGVKDNPCAHVLAVFNEVRAQPHILLQIMRRRRPPEAVA